MTNNQERPNRILHNAVTGISEIVPITDAEWDELKAKQSQSEVERGAEQLEAKSIQEIVDALPSDDEITAAKTADLKDIVLKQNAALRLLVKRAGLES